MLDLKWGYLGGDLDHWSPEDVVKILLDLYPAKVMLRAAADLPHDVELAPFVTVWRIDTLAASAPGLQAMLDTAWRVKGERTDEVLAAIGGHHPDKHVAKAARKVLLKHRNVR